MHSKTWGYRIVIDLALASRCRLKKEMVKHSTKASVYNSTSDIVAFGVGGGWLMSDYVCGIEFHHLGTLVNCYQGEN